MIRLNKETKKFKNTDDNSQELIQQKISPMKEAINNINIDFYDGKSGAIIDGMV